MRERLVVAAAVVILVGAVAGTVWWLDRDARSDERAVTSSGPDEVVTAYLDAWAAGDHDAMRALVRDPPDTLEDDLVQLREGLGVTALQVTSGEVVTEVDGRASATATVSVEVDEVGPVSWEVELRLLRERGEWGLAWAPTAIHPEWRAGRRFAVATEETERTEIVAVDGTVLAGPTERVTLGFDPGAVTDVDEVVAAFEAAIPGLGATAERLLRQGGLVDGWFYPVTSLPSADARDVIAPLNGVPGVLRRTEDGARGLLADGFALHLVGQVAEATAEQLEQLGPPYEPGDVVGQLGLERALERRLAAGQRRQAVLREGDEGAVRVVLAEAGTGTGPGNADGPGDADASGAVATTLDVTVQRAIENTLVAREDAAGVVVVDGRDGAIRGGASRPLSGFDRASGGRYAPGEAFAPVVAEARAAAGLGPDGTVDGDALAAAAQRFGFGVAPDVPVEAAGGSFPTILDGDLPGATAGQGQVEVSPLHLASVAAATTSGTWHVPHLLVEDAGGERRTLDPDGLVAAREALTGDVPDGAGELGLSGIAATARSGGGQVAWFVGTIDDLGLAVLLEDGTPGAAAQLGARFARELRALQEVPVDRDGG